LSRLFRSGDDIRAVGLNGTGHPWNCRADCCESAPLPSHFFTFVWIGRNTRAVASPEKPRIATSQMETTMTDANSAPQASQTSMQPPRPPGARGRSPWLRPLAALGLLLGGVVLGATGYAATAGPDGSAWRQDMRLAFVQHMVARALDGAGASAAQEAKVHDIVAARFAELAPNPDDRAAMRKQALALLAAPAIDRAAVEKLRTDAVAKFDAKSKTIAAAVLEVADQLTPAQRTQLAAEIEVMAQRHAMAGPWGHHGGHWGHWGGPMMDGPDGAPDKN
jgi:periplasmic protein CpxP/Spy